MSAFGGKADVAMSPNSLWRQIDSLLPMRWKPHPPRLAVRSLSRDADAPYLASHTSLPFAPRLHRRNTPSLGSRYEVAHRVPRSFLSYSVQRNKILPVFNPVMRGGVGQKVRIACKIIPSGYATVVRNYARGNL